MSHYRRVYEPGGTYFFTVVTAGRRPWLATARGRRALAHAMRAVRRERPFSTVGAVVLPDHLHTIWALPEGDTAFANRWKSIKQRCTNALKRSGFGEGPFWQPRYWEHLIRDEDDLHRHLDYIHFNPVKHGLAAAPRDWAASSFARCVRMGWYEADWAGPTIEIEPPE